MIRYLGIGDVNLDTFQEDFDLQLRGEGSNSFVPIAEKVRERYPQVDIQTAVFRNGNEKVDFIRQLIQENVPCVISIAHTPWGGWHIVPVVSMDDSRIKIIWTSNITLDFSISDIIHIHDNWRGGKDVAWIKHQISTTQKE